MWAVHQQQMVPLGKVSCEHVCYPDKYGQGTALRSMKLPSKTGESSPQRIFRRRKNHPSKWGDGGEWWVSFPSSPGLPKMMFMSKADFSVEVIFGWNPCKITNTESWNSTNHPNSVVSVVPSWLNPTKRVSPIQLSVHPPFSKPLYANCWGLQLAFVSLR